MLETVGDGLAQIGTGKDEQQYIQRHEANLIKGGTAAFLMRGENRNRFTVW